MEVGGRARWLPITWADSARFRDARLVRRDRPGHPGPPSAGPAAREGGDRSDGVPAPWLQIGSGPATRSGLGLGGLHSARRGDYRVTYRIDDGIWQVTVLAIEQ